MKEFDFYYLLLIFLFSSYAWLVPLKDKNDIIITNDSSKVLNKLEGCKPNEIWVHKGS